MTNIIKPYFLMREKTVFPIILFNFIYNKRLHLSKQNKIAACYFNQSRFLPRIMKYKLKNIQNLAQLEQCTVYITYDCLLCLCFHLIES